MKSVVVGSGVALALFFGVVAGCGGDDASTETQAGGGAGGVSGGGAGGSKHTSGSNHGGMDASGAGTLGRAGESGLGGDGGSITAGRGGEGGAVENPSAGQAGANPSEGGIGGQGVAGGGTGGANEGGNDAAGAGGAGGASASLCEVTSEPAALPSCGAQQSDSECSGCLKAKCCETWQACYGTSPANACGREVDQTGEFNCIRDCYLAGADGVASLDELLTSCAARCQEPCQDISLFTNDLVACAVEDCAEPCFPTPK